MMRYRWTNLKLDPVSLIFLLLLNTAQLSTCNDTREGARVWPPARRAFDCTSPLGRCLNGGTCAWSVTPGRDLKLKNSTYADELTETKCLCLNGFTGDYCEINVDDCLDNRCAAGSTCIDGVGKYTCKCPPGKLGLLCQLDDPCTAKPCKSNSECIVNTASGEYECRCRKGFTGPDCSEDINECALDETICFNGGTCVNTNGSWYCRCPSEYKGRNCMEHIDLCEVSPCRNGGTCLDYGRRIACLCEPGFYGDLCEKRCVGGSPESACLEYERIAAEQDNGPNKSDSGTEAEIGRRQPAETAPERPCPLSICMRKAGDGVCDPECDRVECGWDGADCDGSAVHPFSRCPAEAFCANAFRNSKCDPACATEECLFDGFDCLPDGERCQLEAFCKERHANGQCDPTCNTAACLYDGGDCINQSDPKREKLPGHLLLLVEMEPRRVLARLSELLFGISRLLRAPVDVAHDVDGKAMLYEWSIHRGLAPQLDHTGGWSSGRQLDQSTSQVSGSQLDQSNGPAGIKAPNSTLGTLIVLLVEASRSSCSLDRQCFTDIADVAEFLSTWQSSQALHRMGIPVYSARADTRAGRPSSGTAPTRVLVLLSLAVFGTAVSCVLAIQVVRKRKIVHVARTWFPPAATHHDTCSSSIIAFDGALTGPENDQLLNATGEAPAPLAAKRARRPVYSPVGAIPEPYPSAATPGPHGSAAVSPLKPTSPPPERSTEIHPNSAFCRPEIGYDPTRWTTPLHMEASSTAAITLPINRAYVNVRDEIGRTALMRTAVNLRKCERVSLEDVKNLLDAGALLDELDDNDSSALILAVKAGRCAVVRGLLELGADAGVEDANCRTALHHAAALCALPIVKLLLAQPNTNVNALDDANCTPLMICAKQEMCGVEMAQLLVQAGADVNADGRRVAPDYSGRTALHYAAQLCNLDMIRFLIRSGANKDAQDSKDQTPLFLAASEGHLEAVDLLLNSGASREVTDCQERSPKDVALERQFFDVANRLASTQMNMPDKDNNSDDSLRITQQRVPEKWRKNLKKVKKLIRSNPSVFQRPLVKKIKPTSYQRIAPSEFLTPPQSDNSLTFFSPIQTSIPAGYAPLEPMMVPWGRYEPGHGDISAEPQVPTHILSPPYETGAFVCSDMMPSYNDWREGVIRNSSVVNTTPTQQQPQQQQPQQHPYSLIPAAFALRRPPNQSIDQAFDHQLDQLEPGLYV